MTIVDSDGRFVDRRFTGAGGRYELIAPEPGLYTVICSPTAEKDGVRPRSFTVTLHSDPVVHDVFLDNGAHPSGSS